MSSRARHQTMLVTVTTLVVILILAFIATAVVPIHMSTEKQVIVNVTNGQQGVGIANTNTQALVHYSDGSTETISGDTFVLNPLFAQSSIQGTSPSKSIASIDFENQIIYKATVDLTKFCFKAPDIWGLLFGTQVCPADAMLIVNTDIHITVDGEVVWPSPSNGRYVAYSTNGATSQLTDFSKNFWATVGVLDYRDVKVFQSGDITVPWSKEGWSPDPYRKATQSVTVQVIGTQTYQMYPMYWSRDLRFYLGGGVDLLPNIPVPVASLRTLGVDGAAQSTQMICDRSDTSQCKPVELDYSRPIFQIPPLTVTTPDIVLDLSPKAVTISTNTANDGNLAFATVYAQAYNSYSGTVTFSMKDLPSGVTATFAQNDLAFSSSLTLVESRLQLTAASSAKKGTYASTIVAAATGLQEKTIALTIDVTDIPVTCPGGATCPGSPTVLTASAPSEVVMLFQYTISGKLTSPTGVGILGAKITATTSWGGSGTANTDQNGAYTISLIAPTQEGSYNVAVNFAGDSTYAASNTVNLSVSVRAIPSTWVLIIIAVIAVVIVLAIVGFAMSRRKPGGP